MPLLSFKSFSNAHSFENCGIVSQIFPSFDWGSGIFGEVAYLDQLHASENISWVIMKNMSRATNDIDNYTNFAIGK